MVLPVSAPEALIPRSIWMVVEVSPRDAWNLIKPFLRESPSASVALRKFEQEHRLSVSKDIIPCLGDHVAIGMSGAVGSVQPDMVVVVRVGRKWREAQSLLKRTLAAESKSGRSLTWESHSYRGVRYWSARSTGNSTGARESGVYGILRGCVIFAATQSAVRKSIDTGLGTLPSVLSTGGYTRVTQTLPHRYVARFVCDYQSLMKGMPANTALSDKQKRQIEGWGCMAGTLRFPEGRIRCDFALTATDTQAGKDMLASWKRYGAITRTTYAYLPPTPLVLSTFTNLSESVRQGNGQWDAKSLMFMPANIKAFFQLLDRTVPKSEIAGLASVLTEETSVAISFLPGGEKVSVLCVSEASDEQALVTALDKVDAGFAAKGIQLRKSGVGNTTLRTLKSAPPGGLSLTYAQSGNILIASNDLPSVRTSIARKQTGSESIATSREIAGLRGEEGQPLNSVLFVDLRQVKGLLTLMGSFEGSAQVSAALDRMGVVEAVSWMSKNQWEGNIVTSATLKNLVDSSKTIASAAQQAMMKRMTPHGSGMETPSPWLGKTAPDFGLEDLSGNRWSLSGLRGKVVVLDFFATWCGPCRMELPLVQNVARHFAGKPVQFLLVSAEGPDLLKPFSKADKVTFPILNDTNGNVARGRYSVLSIPQLFLIDGTGRVRRVHQGYSPDIETALTKEIQLLLAGKLPPPSKSPAEGSATAFPSPSPSNLDPFTAASEKARTASCQSNLKQLALGMAMYVQDYDERFPPTDRWSDMIYPYVRNRGILACPSVPERKFGYAMNRNLDRMPLQRIARPAGAALFFDSSAGKANASDSGQSWCQPLRHGTGNNVAFVDGHIRLEQQLPNFDPRK